ncbi:ATP-dependent zinc metalloprotease FtsH [Rubellicoccus peritrichatus]|uniref:ATP-dependent zinc metalloprotease FtsH n=1 Tax=Rubellicoccus peritrichatus TaxID=3080537 RepID=A0AAQ3L8V7_9BACT|nr:ATP-dependent zinc metalloprotease FtsH [Puniceicoccus sp. CR14]WOO41241.1 ATP-dependent zinc metalloprotease FtsH [Puniceicoccus sp. CR14]
MSEDDNQKQSQPNRGGPPDRFQPKVLIIWLAIFASILLLWSLYPGQHTGAQKLSINEVLRLAKEGQITELYIKSDPSGGANWYTVWGDRKNPGLVAADAKGDEKADSSKESDQAKDKAKAELSETVSFQSAGVLTEDRYDQLTDPSNSYKVIPKPASTLMMEIIVSLLPFILIIGLLYFLFVRQLRMAGKGAMSFGKSRAKLLVRDKDRVNFKDVAGCDEAKEEVSEVVAFLKDPKKFQKIGGRVPKGVLMVGPPGTGKTLLAKAVAGEADVPFFSISGSDFVEMFVGVGAARVRDMFEQGRKNAPCIIFIDEIDAVGRQRGAGLGGGNDEREQTLNSLLVEMDGFDGHEGIIIIAATNRPDVLDGALLRPGRFDRQIMIDLPDLNGREHILKVHAKKIRMNKDVDMVRVARSTPGFSGADLANLLNEAALIAARYDKNEVAMADIDEARDKISFGRERRKLMDEEDKRMTAYHEAGHALIQVVLEDKKLQLHKVTIIPRGRALGMTMNTATKDILGQSKKELLNHICMAMGGRIGEEVETGDFSNGASSDIKQATNIARHMVCDWGMSELGPVALGENQEHIFLAREITRSQNYSEETARMIDIEIKKIIDNQYKRATQIITERREALETIAESLLEHETIDGKHVHEILEHGKIISPVINNQPKPEDIEIDKKEAGKKAAKDDDEGEALGPGPAPAGMPA